MKFDIVIIGGGLSGLTCGIKLAAAHRHVAIVSRGQSSLFFNEGSFGLLGFDDQGHRLDQTAEAMTHLPQHHPYQQIGISQVTHYVAEAHQLLVDAGLDVRGNDQCNHTRLTPMGVEMPVWLSVGPEAKDGEHGVLFSNGRSVQQTLQRRFEHLGGTFLLGDEVIGHNELEAREARYGKPCLTIHQESKEALLQGIYTKNLAEERLEADHFVLATGSFYSGGLVADYHKIYEPLFHLDVTDSAAHRGWITGSAFDVQPFMSCGVKTARQWHPLSQGCVVRNLYAVGSLLGAHDPTQLVDKEGVDMITALNVADLILEGNHE